MEITRRDLDDLVRDLLEEVRALGPEGRALAKKFDWVLDDLAKLGPKSQALVRQFRGKIGRPEKSPFAYRQLSRRWRNFERDNPVFAKNKEAARRAMVRREGLEIKAALDLDINTPAGLRDAIAKGEEARAVERAKRRERYR